MFWHTYSPVLRFLILNLIPAIVIKLPVYLSIFTTFNFDDISALDITL